MKKTFFIALAAVLSVGGALATQAETVTGVPSGIVYECESQGTLCQQIPGDVELESGDIVNATTYFSGTGLRFN